MRLHRFLAALLLGLPMATPIPVAAEDAPLAPEVWRWVAVVGLGPPHSRLCRHGQGQQRLPVGEGASSAPPAKPSQALAISLEELGISRRVLTNPLVVAVSPRLQRLLDDSCALDPTKEAEALRLAENEL